MTLTYDSLNRVLTRSYSDSTPTVTNTYENSNIAFSTGQVTKVSSSISITEYTSFDAFGRVLTHKQTTDGQIYTTAYSYNLAGLLVEETYPTSRIVKNTFDDDARLTEVSSKTAGQSSFHINANNFAYTAFGSAYQLRLGNGNWESMQFNSRFQLTQIALGTSQNATNLWKANYEYGELDAGGNPNPEQNNGNITRQIINFAGLSQAFVQTNKYDPSNRLSEAKEMNGSTQTWKQDFGYDRYGNRTSFSQQTTGAPPITQTPTVDPTTNRFATGQGFTYDLNGNVTLDNQNRQFVFNGDNKQVEVRDVYNNTVGLYYYDGSGQRVKKVTSSETTIFVYDAAGRLVAEYTIQPVNNPSNSYLTSDNLGSPRVITDVAGAVVSRRDFMSFGEELNAGTANRSEANGYAYGADKIRQRFTGYEKDIETGLDFAEARYYDNRYGRFTAVDPLLASGKSADPQSFNRYAYVMNNPITSTDSTGLWSDHDWNSVDSGLIDATPDKVEPIDPKGSKGVIPDNIKPFVDELVKHLGYNPWERGDWGEVVDYEPQAYKGWKEKREGDRIWYVWVNDPKVSDVPNDHRYSDIDGNIIQLYGDDSNNSHSWGIYNSDGIVSSDQTNQAPPTFGTFTSMVRMLSEKKYILFPDLLHDVEGYTTYNYAQESSPTWHLSLFIANRYINAQFDFPETNAPITTVEAHRDNYSPVGKPVTHVVFETVPNWIRSKLK